MYCCPNCFNDTFIQSHINANSTCKGKCSFCAEIDVPLVEPIELQDLFIPLVDLYMEDSNGSPLYELIQLDWNIFSIIDNLKQKELLKNILMSDICNEYNPIHLKEKQNIEQWETFRTELKHHNKFFPRNAPSVRTIEPFGKYLGKKIIKGSEYFFRARINTLGKPIESSEMGKPPKKKSTNGRANPIGIPYLYVASIPETAIAEIRGHKGESVTVAKFKMLDNLELADLRNPKTTITPFGLDDDELELIYKNLPFLELLGEELTKPIIPREANLEYLPSQYLSEIIKHLGFHGIIYNSSVSEGVNYVIFNDERLRIVELFQYEITEIITKSEIIDFK
ncbi:MAG TPA: RES domain-containing protein [Bacteroidetes bacterium]|nr:RES domain-containing protein [Bacteroidota bacterium]